MTERPGQALIAAQTAQLRELYPALRPGLNLGWRASWEGPLFPIDAREYRVRIVYYPKPRPRPPKQRFINPCITVISPALDLDADGRVPHTYRNERDPARPLLCVYDPDADEWNLHMALAETIVPWTARWLVFYEGWLATGEWLGGGRHPE